ncbi:MAG: terminase small subunit [Vicinamibacterales bacterium]
MAAQGAVDVATLETYCALWARWTHADGSGLDLFGQVSAKGRAANHSPASVTLSRQVFALEARLGLGDHPPASAGPPNVVGDLVTRRELAAQLGHHMQTITKWEQQGLPIEVRGRKGRSSLYSLANVQAWIARREAAATQSAPGSPNDLVAARAFRERLAGERIKQVIERESGQSMPVDEVKRLMAAEAGAIRAIVLNTYATHADRVFRAASVDGLRGTERVLKELADEILRELNNQSREPAPSAAGTGAA